MSAPLLAIMEAPAPFTPEGRSLPRSGYKRVEMPTAHDWQLARQRITSTHDPARSREIVVLYRLAIADGTRALRSFSKIDEERRADLIHDLLATRLDAILAADSPRALFLTALSRLAIQWIRRKDAEVHESPAAQAEGIDRDPGHAIDVRRALAKLGARDARVLFAVAIGEDRDEIARVHGTSRQNVDQIVSRARRRLAEES